MSELLSPEPLGSTPGHRTYDRSRRVGDASGWEDARRAVLTWGVKTRSGFRVGSPGRVEAGVRQTVTARVLGVTIREPVEVVGVVDEPDRAGFSYRTLPGHPVRGEEAFILSREGDSLFLGIRSLTAPSDRTFWRVMHPLLRVIQVLVRRRYFSALR